MGGTSARQEREYNERCQSKYYMDSEVSITEESTCIDSII
jgi:hypothetical protein